jgi:hypothetical protein
MGKRKGNFNGLDYYRKHMAGPYRQQQRPPMQPQQQAPMPGPSTPRRPRSPTEEADGPGYQVHPKIPRGLQMTCLCSTLPFERHHLIIRTVCCDTEINKIKFIPVSTPYPWLAYYIVANREITLLDLAAAKMAITTRFLHCPDTNVINRMCMEYSLCAHM